MSGVKGRSGARKLTVRELKLRGTFDPVRHADRVAAEAAWAAMQERARKKVAAEWEAKRVAGELEPNETEAKPTEPSPNP